MTGAAKKAGVEGMAGTMRDALDDHRAKGKAADEETLAAKVVVKRIGDYVRAEVYLAQDAHGNPKFIGSAAAVVVEQAVPQAMQAAIAELTRLGTAFYKNEITEA